MEAPEMVAMTRATHQAHWERTEAKKAEKLKKKQEAENVRKRTSGEITFVDPGGRRLQSNDPSPRLGEDGQGISGDDKSVERSSASDENVRGSESPK